jgi:hypothetical protein
MRLAVVVRLSYWQGSLWADTRNGTSAEKLQFVLRRLTFMTAWCRISTLELPSCDMLGKNGMDDAGAESLARVLEQVAREKGV